MSLFRLTWLVIATLCATTASAQNVDPAQLQKKRQAADQSVWADEARAQTYDETFVKLWDDLRAAEDQIGVLASVQLTKAVTAGPAPGSWRDLGDGVQASHLDQQNPDTSPNAFRALAKRLRDDGYRIVQTEWHHATFNPPQSTYNILIDAVGPNQTRYRIKGPMRVTWSDKKDRHGHFMIDAVDCTSLRVMRRQGTPTFEHRLIGEAQQTVGFEDLLAADLDGDGLSELIDVAGNRVWLNHGAGEFKPQQLFKLPLDQIAEAALGDMNGDGRVDLVIAARPLKRGTLSLWSYVGEGSGKFADQPRPLTGPNMPLVSPSGMTLGDIDGDGDLDVFLPQYKRPYQHGQFPTPYYDANDGFPAFLLLNRGDGALQDVTEAAGLAAKRFRRTYRSSFVDLDDDGDLDLLVVSDFSGIDIYHNDGKGRFTDVTSQSVDEAANFGMSHALADFNSDGKLDFYVTGMASTTARRLTQMGLRPSDRQAVSDMRLKIAYGNRMYLHDTPGRYVEPSFRDDVARSGWSWGCAALDFNNDRHMDLYVANGHKSGKSARDYCTRFWCHDVYDSTSNLSKSMKQLYDAELNPLRNLEMSWNGFEHNALFMNLGGENGFANVSFLMDTAMENDCRAVIADDVDGDGRVDLLVRSIVRETGKPNRGQLHLLLNRFESERHWIGVRLGHAPAIAPYGARVDVIDKLGRQTAVCVVGDSFNAQHAPVKHFGLGELDEVEAIEVRWPGGKTTRVKNPAVDRYYVVEPK